MSIRLIGLAPLPVVPRPHQRVLEHRELVGVVAEVVEDAKDQARRDRAASHGDRSGDRRAHLVATHARHEVLARAHGFGQAREFHAVADEVRPHRQHDVDRDVGLACRFEQDLHEGHGLVAGVGDGPAAPEAEQLLELIDDDQQVVGGRGAGLADSARPVPACCAGAWLR